MGRAHDCRQPLGVQQTTFVSVGLFIIVMLVPAWSGRHAFSQATTIPQIQKVSHDSLLLAESIQIIDTTRWSLQGSGLKDSHVRITGICVVAPEVMAKNGLAMLVYDTGRTLTAWRGLVVECPDSGPVAAFSSVTVGSIVTIAGTVREVPSQSLYSETRLQCSSISIDGYDPARISPAARSITDFYVGEWPNGTVKFTSGEPFGGMIVELCNVRTVAPDDPPDGNVMLIDSLGNTLPVADLSRWFTLGSHRDSSSSYSTPVNAWIDTIRGVITSSYGPPAAGGGYCIAPMFPGDIVYGRSSRSLITGSVIEAGHREAHGSGNDSAIGGLLVVLSGKANGLAVTDINGRFTFSGVDSGTYIVSLLPSDARVFRSPAGGVHTITIGQNDTLLGLDFSIYHYRNVIAGSIFEDRDMDGLRDPGEAGLAHAPVWLESSRLDSMYTDPDGYYAFDGIGKEFATVSTSIQPPWEQIFPRYGAGYQTVFGREAGGVAIVNFAGQLIPARIKLKLTVRDSTATNRRDVWWGVRPGAGFGIWSVDNGAMAIDFAEGEVPVPPLDANAFDARFINPNLTWSHFEYGSWVDMRGFDKADQTDRYALRFGTGFLAGGGYPIRLYWSRDEVGGSYNGPVTMDVPRGASVDMKLADSLIIQDESVTYVMISATGPNLPAGYRTRWRMVSVPTQTAPTPAVQIFSSSTPPAFRYYSGPGYAAVDSLEPGAGYWMRVALPVDSGRSPGLPLIADTIPVKAGWNLVGALGTAIGLAEVSAVPPDIRQGKIFGYDQGYYIADSLRPYNGYWVETSEDGILILRARSGSTQKLAQGDEAEEVLRLTLVEATGAHQELSLHSGREGTVDAPPLPPEDAFDARFSTNRVGESVEEGVRREIPIQIQSVNYPVMLSWRVVHNAAGMSLLLGSKRYAMSGTGGVRLSDRQVSVNLIVDYREALPATFRLSQNHPNPFNPSTSIHYAVPVRCRVKLAVYDVRGRIVQVLKDDIHSPGTHSVEWNASQCASGVYWCCMEATGLADRQQRITLTRKMLLLR